MNRISVKNTLGILQRVNFILTVIIFSSVLYIHPEVVFAHTPDGGGAGGGDPETNLPCRCDSTMDPSQNYPPGTIYSDENDNGTLDQGDYVDGTNSGGGQGSSGGGSYTQSTYYTQSLYYTQSAYEDTPTTQGVTTTPAVSLYIQKQGATGWSKNIAVAPGEEVSLRWVVARAKSCKSIIASYYTATPNGTSGSTNTVSEPASGQRNYGITCTNAAGTIANSTASLTVSTAPITLTAIPKIVRTGETSTLTWNVGGRTGCTVAQKINNADSTPAASTGSRDTISLKGETTYKLRCADGSQVEATIRVLPIYSET